MKFLRKILTIEYIFLNYIFLRIFHISYGKFYITLQILNKNIS